MHEDYREAVDRFVHAVTDRLGDRLVSVVLYGSVARGTPKKGSDVDLLVVVEGLPNGVTPRLELLRGPTDEAERVLRETRPEGWISVATRTPEEVHHGGPLFYDMTIDGEREILVDRGGFLASWLDEVRRRMIALGAHRESYLGHPYWVLSRDWPPPHEIDL